MVVDSSCLEAVESPRATAPAVASRKRSIRTRSEAACWSTRTRVDRSDPVGSD